MSQKNLDKFNAAEKYAENNGYRYIIIMDDWFEMNAKTIDYDNIEQGKLLRKRMKQFL